MSGADDAATVAPAPACMTCGSQTLSTRRGFRCESCRVLWVDSVALSESQVDLYRCAGNVLGKCLALGTMGSRQVTLDVAKRGVPPELREHFVPALDMLSKLGLIGWSGSDAYGVVHGRADDAHAFVDKWADEKRVERIAAAAVHQEEAGNGHQPTATPPTDAVRRDELEAAIRQVRKDVAAASADGIGLARLDQVEGELATIRQSFHDLKSRLGGLSDPGDLVRRSHFDAVTSEVDGLRKQVDRCMSGVLKIAEALRVTHDRIVAPAVGPAVKSCFCGEPVAGKTPIVAWDPGSNDYAHLPGRMADVCRAHAAGPIYNVGRADLPRAAKLSMAVNHAHARGSIMFAEAISRKEKDALRRFRPIFDCDWFWPRGVAPTDS